MSQFKYDNYDQQFEENPSAVINNNQGQKIQEEPETFKVLVRQNKSNHIYNASQADTPKKQSRMSMEIGTTKNKLVDQYSKLRSQLQELGEKMDQILEKQRDRKKKKNAAALEEDDRIVEVKKQLKEQQIKMQKNKTEIARLRKNMDNKYDINKIVDKQNQLKHLKKQLETLEKEKESLDKVRRTQDKASRDAEDKDSITKKHRMEEELKQTTQITKKQLQTINEKQKQIRKLHETLIIKEERAKEYQIKLKERKPISIDISESDVSRLENELKELEQQKNTLDKQGNERIRVLEREKRQLKYDLDRKKLIFQEKQKELRLNQMKHKQIIRLISSSQNSQHPNSSIVQSRISKQNKSESKRIIPKNGRQAPKMQSEYDEEFQGQPETKQNEQEEIKEQRSSVEKHDYGFSANIDDDDIIAEV